ncbi:MAG: tetratricopeptide repeat protein [bacterium]
MSRDLRRSPAAGARGRGAERGVFAQSGLIFLAFFGLYLYTSAPAIQFEDTGEFALSAYTLGVSHPPGYPLYVMLGRLFETAPAGGAGFRLSWASGFLSAVSLAVLYLVLRGWGWGWVSAFAAVGALGLARTLWQQSVTIEVYALNVLLLVTLMALVVRALDGSRDARLLPFFFLVLAASFAHHYTTFFAFAPVAAALFLRGTPPGGFGGLMKKSASCLLVFVVGASLYVYLPMASARDPAADWGDTERWAAFTDHLKRAQFAEWETQETFHLETVKKYVFHYFESLAGEFFIPFVFLFLVGMFLAPMERRRTAGFLAYLLVVLTVGIIFFIRFHYMESRLSVFRVFFIGSHVIIAVFAGWAVEGLMRAARGRRGAAWLAAAAVCAAVLWQGRSQFRDNDYRHATMAAWFGEEVLDEIGRDGIAFLQGSQYVSPAMYLLGVEGRRPDVLAFDSHGNLLARGPGDYTGRGDRRSLPSIEAQIMRRNVNVRRLYTAYTRPLPSPKTRFFNEGLLYSVGGEGGCDPEQWRQRVVPPPEAGMWTPQDFESRYADAILVWRLADCHYSAGDSRRAVQMLKSIESRFAGSAMAQLSIGMIYQQWDMRAEAAKAFARALELCPTYADVYIHLGSTMLDSGNLRDAAALYERALELSPDREVALLNLANVRQREGKLEDAAALYKKVIRLNPRAALAWNNLGNIYEQTRDTENAGKSYRKAMKIDPLFGLPHLNLGTLHLARGSTAEAVSELETFISLEPDSYFGHYNLGVAFHGARDYNNAIREYRKALELEPDFFECRANLVKALFESGRRGELEELLLETERMYPKSKERIEWVKEQLLKERVPGGAR